MFPPPDVPRQCTGTPGHYPRPVMSADRPPSGGTPGGAYADRFAVESPEMTAARTRAFHLPGAPPVEPAVGATLAVLAAGVGARSVVSIGSGGGLAGLWLLRGMRADGVLTALDGDAEQLACRPQGVRRGRYRSQPCPADLRHPGRGAPPALARRLRHGRLRRTAQGVQRAPRRTARSGPRRRHAGLPRPAAGRPGRRPHGARSADRRLAGGQPHDPRGRDAAPADPAVRRRPAGGEQTP